MKMHEAIAMSKAVGAAAPAARVQARYSGIHTSMASAAADNAWNVEVRIENCRTGNRTLHTIRVHSECPEVIAAHARAAMGKASQRDRATLALMAAEDA